MNTNNHWRGSVLILSSLSIIFLLSSCVAKPFNVNENKPRIYGLTHNLNGGGGFQLVDINYDTGIETKPRGLGITTAVFGIAREYGQATGQNYGIITALEPASSQCYSGTAFYRVDLNTGLTSKRGVAVGYDYIEDIEYNPADKKLYGIYKGLLVRIDNLGTCPAGANGTSAQVVDLGNVSNVGEGPYSLYFDHLGACYIVSGKDHHVAAVEIPATPNLGGSLRIIGPVLVDASWSQPPNINFMSVAACMSGTTPVSGIVFTSGSSTGTKDYYHLGNPFWLTKGKPAQVIDYTSEARVPGPK